MFVTVNIYIKKDEYLFIRKKQQRITTYSIKKMNIYLFEKKKENVYLLFIQLVILYFNI